VLIAVVGDYNAENETHTTIDASLAHAGVEGEWISTDSVPSADELEERFAGIWLAPASPYRSMDGALAAVTTARERGIPLVATCGGFQHVLVEYARNVLGVDGAEHAETSPEAADLVVTPLSCSLWGQEHAVTLVSGTQAAELYGVETAVEDYFCSYGLSPEYQPRMEESGLRVSGVDGEGEPRIVELEEHPFFVATLFCFQTRSREGEPHPLVVGFADAASQIVVT
jgi:CTP synthase (UTP-ammonia lyase)